MLITEKLLLGSLLTCSHLKNIQRFRPIIMSFEDAENHCSSFWHWKWPFCYSMYESMLFVEGEEKSSYLAILTSKLHRTWVLLVSARTYLLPEQLVVHCSVAKSCPTLCHPVDCSMPGFPVLQSFTISQSLLKLMSIELVMPFNHLILCLPLLFLPSIFPSIKVISNE